jgi:hypothetical protein
MDGLDPARLAALTVGSGLIVGTVASDGSPFAMRAWSAALVGVGTMRIGLGAARDEVAHLANRPIAVTAADVRTLESVQVKGRVRSIEPPHPDDLALAHVQSEAFFAAINEQDGHPFDVLRRLMPDSITMVEIDVTEVYDQSPGPRAGARIESPA